MKELKGEDCIFILSMRPWEWNPVKELKAQLLFCSNRLGQPIVESGEGIESQKVVLDRRVLSPLKWNPVKELKETGWAWDTSRRRAKSGIR